MLEKSSPAHLATALQTQHMSLTCQMEPPTKKAATAMEDDEDYDIALSGSDRRMTRRLSGWWEEWLQEYAEKAKKPALVSQVSSLLDVNAWDDEMCMAQLEAHMCAIRLDGLTCGASKLVTIGYGIPKLQIHCLVEDGKLKTDLLEEEITKFKEHVNSVDVAAFLFCLFVLFF